MPETDGLPSLRVSRALGFFKGVLDGVVENGLRFWGILAFLIVSKPRLFLFLRARVAASMACLAAFPFVLDAAFLGKRFLCAPVGDDCGLLQVVLHHVQSIRDAFVGDLLWILRGRSCR